MNKLVFSLLVTVIGLVVVFSVLVILTFISALLKHVNRIPTREDIKNKLKRRSKPTEALAAADRTTGEPPVPELKPATVEGIEPGELNAVIAAAISAYIATEPLRTVCENGIVVRSVRRAGNWNSAGRYDRLSNKI